MSRDESLPFNRGETYYNGGTIPAANDPLGPGGINLEGKEFLAEVNPQNSYGAQADPSGRKVRVRVARNRSTVNLLPRRIARYAVGTANANFPLGTGCDGYVNQATDLPAGVIDEFLPAAGVPPGDLFYLVVQGPTQVITATTGTIAVPAGSLLQAQTGTSATSADSGFVVAMPGTPTILQTFQIVGRAEANLSSTIATTSTVFSAVANCPFAYS